MDFAKGEILSGASSLIGCGADLGWLLIAAESTGSRAEILPPAINGPQSRSAGDWPEPHIPDFAFREIHLAVFCGHVFETAPEREAGGRCKTSLKTDDTVSRRAPAAAELIPVKATLRLER